MTSQEKLGLDVKKWGEKRLRKAENIRKDKFICEKLGICWHEWVEYKCRFCGEFDCVENPDFTSEAGRVQLLKLIDNIHEWNLHLRSIWPHIVIGWIKDDTGKFRDAVFEWLGGEG